MSDLTPEATLQIIAKAIVQVGNLSWEAPIDWDYISKDPQNEWYLRAMEQARAALLALARADLSEDMINTGWEGGEAAVRFDDDFRALIREIAAGQNALKSPEKPA